MAIVGEIINTTICENRLSTPSGQIEDKVESMDEQVFSDYFPSISAEVVEKHIWPVIAESPSTLLHLRAVSRRWRALVDDSYEWNGLLLRYGLSGAAEIYDKLLAERLDIDRSKYSSWRSIWE